ncbi:hypothetical protein EVAR_19102_1 [Eumeta japonica]|uniref:Reverse transcriptase domain-containing protein n=1 Tax=Eumeta variegata TaxID=151549 RepID=A0A4C1UQJ4_EUMVA|nr:hypothetical protein EVAR_19102_1 [Eumeta japonica]
MLRLHQHPSLTPLRMGNQILKNIYSKSTANVKLERTGENFLLKEVLDKETLFIPSYSLVAWKWSLETWNGKKNGLIINGENLNHLSFADDTVVFSENPDNLKDMFQLSDESAKVDLSINTLKTKVMTNSTQKDIKINGG